MSLATTTARLELAWRRHTRRDPPTDRWATAHPVLDADLDELRARLADRDRTSSGPVLAALVQLAMAGDHSAALLVTLTLLPRMVHAEKRRDERDYDDLAGDLWEAVVTASNPQARYLRETLERNAWRRYHRQQRHREPAVPMDLRPERIGGIPPLALAAAADTERDALAGRQLHATLEQLAAHRAITPTTRRLLERLAADGDITRPGQDPATARKQRWRMPCR